MTIILRVDDLPVVICCPQPELTARLAQLLAEAFQAATGAVVEAGEARPAPVVAAEVAE